MVVFPISDGHNLASLQEAADVILGFVQSIWKKQTLKSPANSLVGFWAKMKSILIFFFHKPTCQMNWKSYDCDYPFSTQLAPIT